MNLENLAQELALEKDESLETADRYIEACASDIHKSRTAIADENARLEAVAVLLHKRGLGQSGFHQSPGDGRKD